MPSKGTATTVAIKKTDNNNIGGEGARALSEALQVNMTLTALDLCRVQQQQSSAKQGHENNYRQNRKLYTRRRSTRTERGIEGQHNTGITGPELRAATIQRQARARFQLQ